MVFENDAITEKHSKHRAPQQKLIAHVFGIKDRILFFVVLPKLSFCFSGVKMAFH